MAKMLKDAKLRIHDKALKYGDSRFISVVRPVLKKANIIATDEEILKLRDSEKEKRFGKPKAKKEAPKKEAAKPKAKKAAPKE